MRKSIQWSLGVGVGILLVSLLVGGLGLGGAPWVAIRAAEEARGGEPSQTASRTGSLGGERIGQAPLSSEGAISQTCALDCQATVPVMGQLGAEVLFEALVEASGCGGTPSFQWDFGDGTPVSSDQNVGHTYTATGT